MSARKESSQNEVSTKEKILTCAVNLFAKKGYTETTIRELADAAGLKGASIYNHFPSKNAILEHILKDYLKNNANVFDKESIYAKLSKDPTANGIINCLTLAFPEGMSERYLKVLCVLLQEQHRNPLIQDFMANHIILSGENYIKSIFQILKDLKILRHDVDLDPWAKIHSSLLYAFSSRMLLGIGDASSDFSGMGMVDLIRFQFSMLLKISAA